MKLIISFFAILSLACFATTKETSYTGSTPASSVVRAFLGIPLTDSIDFIRWKLSFHYNRYQLACNYGIGKPNTNGFYDGGKKIELNGQLRKEKNYYQLLSGDRVLNIVELNEDLIHLLDNNKNLLVGTSGWSYTLNSISPSGTNDFSLKASTTGVKDSIVFSGRTPCGVPGVIEPGKLCYKLKWKISLYANRENNGPGTCRVLGTPYRANGGRTGSWNILNAKDGKIIYKLNDEHGNGYLYLLKLDERVVMFTDANGKILVGDEDFSYTLNRSGQAP